MHYTRREIIRHGSMLCLATMLGCTKRADVPWNIREKEFEVIPVSYTPYAPYFSDDKPLVSIVKVNEKLSDARAIEYAVTKAIDLIGGIGHVAKGQESILLKPNLVSPSVSDTTKPLVVESLAVLMKKAGKEVQIGEASCASASNIKPLIRGFVCAAKEYAMLEDIQNDVFHKLGYLELSRRISVPLVNLHVGRMARMIISDNFVLKELFLHEALHRADMICSVPMMKTHGLAGVTLALKNVGIGAYPGLVYGSIRSMVHRKASDTESSGTATAIVDMVKANKIGLSVVDATMAMEGQGPSTAAGGKLVKLGLIIAGTNPLATDIVAAQVMGFNINEIDTFKWAFQTGMKPSRLEEIQIAGEPLANVQRPFAKPWIIPYNEIRDWYGPPC